MPSKGAPNRKLNYFSIDNNPSKRIQCMAEVRPPLSSPRDWRTFCVLVSTRKITSGPFQFNSKEVLQANP